MADEQRPEEVQRWTAKRRAALVISLLKGETTAAEAARRHGLKLAEVEDWRTHRDPITRLRQHLERTGVLLPGGYDAAVERARQEVAEAIAFAEASPWPDTADVMKSWPQQAVSVVSA